MNLTSSAAKSKLASLAGILAVIAWSSNIAVSKTVMNEMGTYHAAFLIYIFAGILNFLILLFALGRTNLISHFKKLPVRYYLHTGIFFIMNNIFLYTAIGLAKKDEELLIVALLNYLWPVLIFIFRVPLFRARIKPFLFYPAIIFAVTGIIIALLQGYNSNEMVAIITSLDDNFLAFLFAFMGAVSWALYSNLIRKYRSGDDIAAMPLIFIISGLVFLTILFARGEMQSLDLHALISSPSLFYIIIGPTCLGYLFWFLAMKYGNRNMVTSLSYLIPMASVFLVSLVHSIPVRPMFWVSVILLIAAAGLGMKAFEENHTT